VNEADPGAAVMSDPWPDSHDARRHRRPCASARRGGSMWEAASGVMHRGPQTFGLRREPRDGKRARARWLTPASPPSL